MHAAALMGAIRAPQLRNRYWQNRSQRWGAILKGSISRVRLQAVWYAPAFRHTIKYNELLNDQNGPWLAVFQEAVFGQGVENAMKDGQQTQLQGDVASAD